MALGNKMRALRMQKGLKQEQIAEKLGYLSTSYISDAENNKFIPAEEKLKKWAEALRISWEEMKDLVLEAELEELGIQDPAFTMMFKDIPRMTYEEKQSIIRAYEAVVKARDRKRIMK